MSAYAIAHLRNVDLGPAIAEYLARIDATLAPFEGRFVVHGATPEVREGRFDDTVIVIGFPDIDHARGWYDSPAYRDILPLRTEHADGEAFLVEGVGAGHRATDVLG